LWRDSTIQEENSPHQGVAPAKTNSGTRVGEDSKGWQEQVMIFLQGENSYDAESGIKKIFHFWNFWAAFRYGTDDLA